MTAAVVARTALIKDDDGLLKPIRPHNQPLLELSITTHIQSSPYSELSHQLDLSTISLPYQLLSIALQSLFPINDYTSADYDTVFNFAQVFTEILPQICQHSSIEFPGIENVYIVAFRSKVWKETQQSSERRQVLADIDKASHEEANISGGLLKYWFGTPHDVTARNLATCFWRSRADAKAGGGGQAHRQGMRRVRGWFEEWHIEEYSLSIAPGATSYALKPYTPR
ncbi:hypothetical protein TRVA0_039S00958 [Trichomonascus vanleenenianus]|uniref:uncharacterized protein n=1 Tax=Trichomonascus vanleenenianus TaxID=2268995 RepID=UPI003ECAE937